MERVKEFYALAKEYNEFVERNEISKETIPGLMELLMKLYCSFQHLPESDTLSDAEPEYDSIDDTSDADVFTEWKKIKLDEKINPFYWVIFNPLVPDPKETNELCSGNILDDIIDIKRDLFTGIKEYDRENYCSAVTIWSCLHSHWGKHLVNLLKTLHELMNER